MFTAYYYDHTREQFPGIDSNELYVNGKFVSMITKSHTANRLIELEPSTETEEIVLIVSDTSNIDIVNHNPCPDDPLEDICH